MSQTNPFAALLCPDTENKVKPPKKTINDLIEQIFAFTINPKHVCEDKLFLEEVMTVQGKTELNLSSLRYTLFERLFMCNDNAGFAIKNNSKNHAHETRIVNYLFCCYKELIRLKDDLKSEEYDEINDNIVLSVANGVLQPDIYSGQNIVSDMVDILKKDENGAHDFFVECCNKIIHEDNNSLEVFEKFVEEMNKIVVDQIEKSALSNYDQNVFNYFNAMLKNETIAEVFIESCTPKPVRAGYFYASTPFGALLTMSALPTPKNNNDYFLNPRNEADNSATSDHIWTCLQTLISRLHKTFEGLLRISPKTKHKTLNWVGDCLKHNSSRGTIWNYHMPELNPAHYRNVCDGFMINLCHLLLKLCHPFCSKIKDEKILKVDPTYCAVTNEQAEAKNVHMKDMSNETCFVPCDKTENRLTSQNYSFISEIFFMTHRAFDLGIRVCIEKLLKKSIEMMHLQRAITDAAQQGGGNSDLMSTLNDRMDNELKKYISLKYSLTFPDLLSAVFDFFSSSCHWLSQVGVRNKFEDDKHYAPLIELPINFPLPTPTPHTLQCIPEFLIENIISLLVFTQNCDPSTFEIQGYEKLSPILTFILIYMGSEQHLKNPHIRARLAEGLESLLPFKAKAPTNNIWGTQRERLFTEHPHRLYIVENLMKVFVSIEMTGQSVEFEQKFNYRKPMYGVFEYLWTMPEHVECFNNLAVEAEKNMESVTPPLFLKFINLLINDAIFLLDESLTNMAKLREMQHAHDNGDWNNLTQRERTQNMESMQHIGHLARFDNILGKDTIKLLENLTSRIKIVFTHPTMVDRIAAMLNYFLLNLVGPNKKNFKVKNPDSYSFNPADTVLEICKIYVNLKESDSFCLAVSQDGRSYSPELFTLAEGVLVKIGGGALIGELKDAAVKVAEKARESQANEEVLSEAPDHFLDPIMSTVMTDPVILPSSRQTVDRSTIARHLLSDQTDPFNRSPLSMEQVIPNKELAEEIRNWIGSRTKK